MISTRRDTGNQFDDLVDALFASPIPAPASASTAEDGAPKLENSFIMVDTDEPPSSGANGGASSDTFDDLDFIAMAAVSDTAPVSVRATIAEQPVSTQGATTHSEPSLTAHAAATVRRQTNSSPAMTSAGGASARHKAAKPGSSRSIFGLFASEPCIRTVTSGPIPARHWSTSNLQLDQRRPIGQKSFHSDVFFVPDNIDGKEHVLKMNPGNPMISMLEVVVSEYFRLLAPGFFPRTRVVRDPKTKKIIGVLSEKEEAFKSLRRFQKELTEKQGLTGDKLKKELKETIYENVKKHITTLMTHYILASADNHANNNGNIDIDGDMLVWPLLSKVKDSNTIDALFPRSSSEASFALKETDIRNFPNKRETDAYWPTYRGSSRGQLTENEYTCDEVAIFRSLATNPAVKDKTNYYKFKTALKFLLSPTKIFCNIAKLHLRPEDKIDGENVLELLTTWMSNRNDQLREVVKNMPEFKQFMQADTLGGKQAIKEIIAEFVNHNRELSEDIAKAASDENKKAYVACLINPEDIKRNANELTAALGLPSLMVEDQDSTPSPRM